jgi:hypothetical protein
MSLTPTPKSPEVDGALKALGFDRLGAIKAEVCTGCAESVGVDSFDDELSQREYRISGLCQKCQNWMFA